MKWRRGRRSGNIEDRRGRRMRVGRGAKGGGIGIIVIALIAIYFGVDPSIILQGGGGGLTGGPTVSEEAYQPTADEQELA